MKRKISPQETPNHTQSSKLEPEQNVRTRQKNRDF